MTLHTEQAQPLEGPDAEDEEPLTPLEELRRQLKARVENHAADATEIARNAETGGPGFGR
jgi:hypothetical protein